MRTVPASVRRQDIQPPNSKQWLQGYSKQTKTTHHSQKQTEPATYYHPPLPSCSLSILSVIRSDRSASPLRTQSSPFSVLFRRGGAETVTGFPALWRLFAVVRACFRYIWFRLRVSPSSASDRTINTILRVTLYMVFLFFLGLEGKASP